MPNNTNVVLCDRTLHLVKEDSKSSRAGARNTEKLIEQLVKIGWSQESDLKGDDKQTLRMAFAERFTPEAIKLLNNKKASGHDTAPDWHGNHFTHPSGKPKNKTYWNQQISSGLNKYKDTIIERGMKKASGSAPNTKGDIFFRVERDIGKLMKSVKIEHDKTEDEMIQKKLKVIISLMKETIGIHRGVHIK